MRRLFPILLAAIIGMSTACTSKDGGATSDPTGSTGEPTGLSAPPTESSTGPTGSTGGIDWSSPVRLPHPRRDDFRSEFVSEEDGYRFWPRSALVSAGVAYRFDTGHCGLTFMTDFDGSFWSPMNPGDPDAPDFFHNQESGAIALVDADTARYRSADGLVVALERLPGPIVTPPCE